MADQCALRVMRELKHLEESDQITMTVHYKESNIREVTAVILGPPGTPYALGFYQFVFTIPADYPAKPPIVKIKTTNTGRTRFGPNLYANGKVCLSILGTWHSQPGEEWSPAQGVETVLLSIQSLLSSNPYLNEPGFEDHSSPEDLANMEVYSAKIRHENLRLAVIEPLEEALALTFRAKKHRRPRKDQENEGDSDEEKPQPGPFDDYFKKRFLWYLELYKQTAHEGATNDVRRHGMTFKQMPFETPSNEMAGIWNYPSLQQRLHSLEKMVMDETHGWPVEGLALAKKDVGIAVSLRGQHEQIVSELSRRTDSLMVDLELEEYNPFLWKLTYFGRPLTRFDGGVLVIKIYISPRHPVEQPRVFVETPLYHVRVSTNKVLMYLPARADEMSRHIEGIISALEEEEPAYNPLMTVNPEAAKLCWGSKDEQRQYNRKLRRSVQESAEHLSA